MAEPETKTEERPARAAYKFGGRDRGEAAPSVEEYLEGPPPPKMQEDD